MRNKISGCAKKGLKKINNIKYVTKILKCNYPGSECDVWICK